MHVVVYGSGGIVKVVTGRCNTIMRPWIRVVRNTLYHLVAGLLISATNKFAPLNNTYICNGVASCGATYAR